MIYDKKIRYLDYCENGARVKGSGFVKWELRNGSLKIEIMVTGMSHNTTVTSDVILLCGDKEMMVGRIGIAEGRGQYFYLCQNADNIADTGIGYGEVSGLRIPLGENREISGSWQPQKATAKQEVFPHGAENRAPEKFMDQRTAPEQPEEKRTTTQERKRKTEEKGKEEEREKGRKNTADWPKPEEIKAEDMAAEKAAVMRESQGAEVQLAEKPLTGWPPKREEGVNRRAGEDVLTESLDEEASVRRSVVREKGVGGGADGEKKKTERRPVLQRENKWDQIWAIYPHIRPFRDGREYLSIAPADFVLFPSASYRMVNNSFLLHGYYNYHHLILAKVEKRGETYYYIGVPGNYYEREKQVAIMFGFESFECAEEPAQAGDFGYYMMRTEL